MREGRRAGGRVDGPTLSLSLANACNPYCKRIPLAQDNTSHVFPPCVPSRANPFGLGHAATILLVGPGTPQGRNADTVINGPFCMAIWMAPATAHLEALPNSKNGFSPRAIQELEPLSC
jgi:hypothetical protein